MTAVPATHREVRVAARPGAVLGPEHFEVVEAAVPDPGPSQVLVRNRVMTVTAVMRNLMGAVSSPPLFGVPVGETLSGGAIGQVVGTGQWVRHNSGWREYAALDKASLRPIDPDSLLDPAAHLSQGGIAWAGIVHGAEVRAGDVVFVSGAAGGVGVFAGQVARLRGASRVIGSTGSPEKAARLTEELGYNAVVLRGSGSFQEQLADAAPQGVDAVFDTVGGEQLRAALSLARRKARFALIGALAGQLGGREKGEVVLDPMELILRSVTVRGMAAYDHGAAVDEWHEVFARGLRDGTLRFPHTTFTGIDQAPRALCELVEGRHLGAVLVEL